MSWRSIIRRGERQESGAPSFPGKQPSSGYPCYQSGARRRCSMIFFFEFTVTTVLLVLFVQTDKKWYKPPLTVVTALAAWSVVSHCSCASHPAKHFCCKRSITQSTLNPMTNRPGTREKITSSGHLRQTHLEWPLCYLKETPNPRTAPAQEGCQVFPPAFPLGQGKNGGAFMKTNCYV